MIATIVHVWVREPFIDDFIKASVENHENSIKEAGNLRFDLLTDTSDKTKFVFYEVYESEEAIALHKTTAHYLKWRDTVADWMARPREGFRHNVIRPVNRSLW